MRNTCSIEKRKKSKRRSNWRTDNKKRGRDTKLSRERITSQIFSCKLGRETEPKEEKSKKKCTRRELLNWLSLITKEELHRTDNRTHRYWTNGSKLLPTTDVCY